MRRSITLPLLCLFSSAAMAQQQLPDLRIDAGPGRQGRLVWDNGYNQPVQSDQKQTPELTFSANNPGFNVLAIQSLNGISGIAYRDAAGVEKAAFGYSAKTQGANDGSPFYDTAFWEISTYCGVIVGECTAKASDSQLPPIKARIIQTGYVKQPDGTSTYGNFIKQEFTADGATTRFWKLGSTSNFPLAINNLTGKVFVNWPGTASAMSYPTQQNTLDVFGSLAIGDVIEDRTVATTGFNITQRFGNIARWKALNFGTIDFTMLTASAALGGAMEFQIGDATNGRSNFAIVMDGSADVRLGGSLRMTNKGTAAGTAPGASIGKLEFRCGTNAGTARLVAYSGTSATAATLLDNIGAGVTGC